LNRQLILNKTKALSTSPIETKEIKRKNQTRYKTNKVVERKEGIHIKNQTQNFSVALTDLKYKN
jgi:hypothetical protein